MEFGFVACKYVELIIYGCGNLLLGDTKYSLEYDRRGNFFGSSLGDLFDENVFSRPTFSLVRACEF